MVPDLLSTFENAYTTLRLAVLKLSREVGISHLFWYGDNQLNWERFVLTCQHNRDPTYWSRYSLKLRRRAGDHRPA